MDRINQLSLHRLIEIADTMPGSAIEHRTYHQGEVLFEEDTYAKGIYYLEQGTILLNTTEHSGKEAVVHVIAPNNFIGFLPLIQKSKHTSTAIVLENLSHIKFISKAIFTEALTDNRFANGFIKILCQKMTINEIQLVQFKNQSVDKRLATALVSLDRIFKKGAKDNSPIIRLKKKDIASMIGVAPETLSRRLAEFEQEGLIELHIKGIKVKDKEQLSTLAG
jgi:CRP/FNR family transcriptional regulator